MDWPMMEQIYLALSRVFDAFMHFLNSIFGEDKAE
jgi:hypothetical protein